MEEERRRVVMSGMSDDDLYCLIVLADGDVEMFDDVFSLSCDVRWWLFNGYRWFQLISREDCMKKYTARLLECCCVLSSTVHQTLHRVVECEMGPRRRRQYLAS